MLKPGEAEAISAWWQRHHALQGGVHMLLAAAGGCVIGSVLFAVVSVFIDLN